MALVVKNPTHLPVQLDVRDSGLMPGLGRSLEEGTATHSCIVAWRIPRKEEPRRLQCMGLPRVGHD